MSSLRRQGHCYFSKGHFHLEVLKCIGNLCRGTNAKTRATDAGNLWLCMCVVLHFASLSWLKQLAQKVALALVITSAECGGKQSCEIGPWCNMMSSKCNSLTFWLIFTLLIFRETLVLERKYSVLGNCNYTALRIVRFVNSFHIFDPLGLFVLNECYWRPGMPFEERPWPSRACSSLQTRLTKQDGCSNRQLKKKTWNVKEKKRQCCSVHDSMAMFMAFLWELVNRDSLWVSFGKMCLFQKKFCLVESLTWMMQEKCTWVWLKLCFAILMNFSGSVKVGGGIMLNLCWIWLVFKLLWKTTGYHEVMWEKMKFWSWRWDTSLALDSYMAVRMCFMCHCAMCPPRHYGFLKLMCPSPIKNCLVLLRMKIQTFRFLGVSLTCVTLLIWLQRKLTLQDVASFIIRPMHVECTDFPPTNVHSN